MAPDPANLDRDAAQRVLRRALELAERDASAATADDISERALVEAAEELGMDPGVVRCAAAEERLGVLVHDRRVVDRLAGPDTVSATRVVERPAPALLEIVDQWLRRNGAVRRRRMDPGALVADYARRSDPVAGLQRSVRAVRGEEHLGRVRRLRVVVQPVDADRSVVALVADLGAERAAAVAGGSSVGGLGALFSTAEALGGSGVWWLGVPASCVAGVGLLRWRARTVPDVELALQGVLDRVLDADAGIGAGVVADVRERLRSGLARPRRTA